MAGNLALKTGTTTTITSSGGSTTTGTATSAGTIDIRSGGTANLVEMIEAYFELTCQWGTTTGITAGTVIADLYLVPAIDGTNYATVDTTSGSSYISSNFRLGSFVSPKALSTSTDYKFATPVGPLFCTIYTVYILNRSGQTISANWTLKVLADQGQYT
jgi:hypothetical protein